MFLHYLGKHKAKNCVFSLNAERCFITRSQLNCPIFLQELAVCIKQDLGREYSMLPSVTTHSSFTKYVKMSVAVSKVGVVLCRASSQKSMDNISGICYYLNKC